MTGKVIHNLLSNSTAATYVSDRIYPARRLQEDDLPAITYNHVSTTPTNTKDGPSVLDTERFTIHVWSKEYLNAMTIAGIVRDVLDRYTGLMEGVMVDSASFVDQNHLYEDWAEVHHIAIDFNFRIKRNP